MQNRNPRASTGDVSQRELRALQSMESIIRAAREDFNERLAQGAVIESGANTYDIRAVSGERSVVGSRSTQSLQVPKYSDDPLRRFAPLRRLLLEDSPLDLLSDDIKPTPALIAVAKRHRRQNRRIFRLYLRTFWRDLKAVQLERINAERLSLGDYWRTNARAAWWIGEMYAASVLHFFRMPSAAIMAQCGMMHLEALMRGALRPNGPVVVSIS